MEQYETPIMIVTDFRKDVRTSNDVVVNSAIGKGDNNSPFEGPEGF